MKKFLLLWSCALICGLVFIYPALAGQTVKLADTPSSMTILNEDRSGMTIELNLSSLEFLNVSTNDGPFVLLTADGLVRSQRIGEPNLPTGNRLMAIPFGCELQAQVLNSQYEEISLTDLGLTDPLMPVQPSLSKSQDPATISFEYNRPLYAKAGFYQPPLVEAKTIGIMRSTNMGLISIAPFGYDPNQKVLKVYKKVTVRINYLHPDWNQTQRMQEQFFSPAFEPIYSQLANYDNFKQESMITADLTKYPIKYLIVSARMFQAQLAPFIDWQTKRGFKVIVAYTDSIGTTNTAIKAYIRAIYNAGTPQDPAPSFVLLVGDAQQIPPFAYTGHISDLGYCEYTNDNIPEIYYGRWSAQTTAQLQPQIDKTLEYEKYQMPDPSYLGRVTMIAGVDASHAPTWGNGQINYGTNNYFNAAHGLTSNTYLYPASSQPTAAAAIRQTVNDGVGYINYTAHGSHDGWADPEFSSTQVNQLTNTHKYTFSVGNCCLTNTFGTDYSTPCQGETWLQAANKGAIGYIGASNSSYWDEDYWWGVGFKTVSANPTYDATKLGAYDGIFHDHSEPVTENYIYADAILFRGNLAVTQANGANTAYYWQIYHLMGEPSLIPYMRVPSANAVTHSATVLITATTFTVAAVPGSYVGISYNGVLKGSAYVGTTGSVDVPIIPLGVPGTADVVVTAQNRIPYVATIQVISPSGPYVIFDRYTINDASGNNDSLVNNGENIVLGVQLKNVGPDAANSVTATMATTDTFVTISDNSEAYGTIPGSNGTVNRPNAFAFHAGSNTPDGHVINFPLTISGTALITWNANMYVTVHAPVLGYVSVAVSDPSGNNNGMLDPGETANVTVTLHNSGSGAATTTTGTLSASDSYVTIPHAHGTFGNIASGADGANTSEAFVVSASSSCPMGHAMACNLQVTTASGYVVNLAFNLTVGDRVVFFSDDFSTNQGWTGTGGSGEWTIGAATGGTGSDTYGGPDPATDHSPSSDNKVLGNDLTSGTGGDYNASLSQTYYVTSPTIDCSNYTSIQMTYYRWLGVEQNTYDHAKLEAYNGTTWVTLFENGTATIDETSWNLQSYDLTTIADHNASFKIRFGIGITDGSWNWCGWNIDDISIKGYGQGTQTHPHMTYLPNNIIDSLVQGQVAQQNLQINNSGDGELRVHFSSANPWIVTDDSTYAIAPSGSLTYHFGLDATTLGTPGNHTATLDYTSNDADHTSGNIPVTLYIYPADMAIPQTSISDSLQAGQQAHIPLVILNNGAGQLNVDINASVNDLLLRRVIGKSVSTKLVNHVAIKPLGYKFMDSDKGGSKEPYYPPVITQNGGPDLFGHKWIDSDNSGGPAVGWIDISGVGTQVTLTDDSNSGALAIGFGFPFFENSYNDVFIGSNGILTFGSGSAERNNTNLPNTSLPNNTIAMWWDDLNPANGGHIFYYHDIQAGRFIASFDSIPNYLYPSGTGSLSFQAVLYPSGKIVLNYATMNPGTDNLTEASIGIENYGATDGLGVVYNAAYMHSQMTILINTGGWLSADPTACSIAPHSRDTIDVLLDASDLTDGDYTGQLLILSNDPDMDSVALPVTLRIGAGSVCDYIPGDINNDGLVRGSDVSYAVRYFKGFNPPPADSCWDDSMSNWVYVAGDVNGSCEFRGSDVTTFVSFFKGNISALRYCHRTPPTNPLLKPNWIGNKETVTAKKDALQKIETNSVIKKAK